jgi:hypothetical protein
MTLTGFIDFDDRQFRQLTRRLRRDAPKALGYAARNALNRAAFDARKRWQREMQNTFVLRNRWTLGSIRVEKTRGLVLSRMESRVGSGLEYLAKQEEGGPKGGGGIHGQPIPTSVASGEGRGARPRRRVIRPRFRLSAIQLGNRPSGSRKRRNAAAIRMAQEAGSKYTLIESSKGAGIVQVPRASKRKRRRKLSRGKVQMLWSLQHSGVQIPPHPTLGPAFHWTERRLRRYSQVELLKQLRRVKLA